METRQISLMLNSAVKRMFIRAGYSTMYPRSSDPFYIVTYYIKKVPTACTQITLTYVADPDSEGSKSTYPKDLNPKIESEISFTSLIRICIFFFKGRIRS